MDQPTNPYDSPQNSAPSVQPSRPPNRLLLLWPIAVGVAAFAAAWFAINLVVFALDELATLPLTAPLVVRYFSLAAAGVIGIVVGVRYRALGAATSSPVGRWSPMGPIVAIIFPFGCYKLFEVVEELLLAIWSLLRQ